MAETSMKPCPFCESKNVQVVLFDTPHLERWHRVECQTCMSKSPGSKYVALSIAAWNRRATDPAVAELVAALRTVQLARINGLFDAAIEHQIAGDVDGVFAEVDAALAKHAAKP